MEDFGICEACNASNANGTYNLDDVETALCAHCATYRNADGSVVLYEGTD